MHQDLRSESKIDTSTLLFLHATEFTVHGKRVYLLPYGVQYKHRIIEIYQIIKNTIVTYLLNYEFIRNLYNLFEILKKNYNYFSIFYMQI